MQQIQFMQLVDQIRQHVQKFATDHHSVQIDPVEVQPTKKDHEGDITVVVFPLLRFIKKYDSLTTAIKEKVPIIFAPFTPNI